MLGVPQGWTYDNNPKSLGIHNNTGLTPEQIETRNRRVALEKGAQLLTAKGVEVIDDSNDADLMDSDDEESNKGAKKDTWSGKSQSTYSEHLTF